MIEVRELKKSFRGKPVLDGVSFQADQGTLTLLIGANGCGKTTLLRILAGLLPYDSGCIRWNGRDPARKRGTPIDASQFSFLPQKVQLHPRLTCLDVLRFYSRLRRLPPDRIEAALIRTGLQDYRNMPTGRLSGGLRQRLGLAILMLPDSPILLLDEPGLSLDPPWRSVLQEQLREESRRGKTILVSTHLTAEWDGKADRCLAFQSGSSVMEIPPDQLTRHPLAEPASIHLENAQ